ncbi:MAG: FG-GAP repeat protein, partial [Planctomycetaceae bacterium]|nr:FG-GAP repeat protein [Planctomycetaceae bacterium]
SDFGDAPDTSAATGVRNYQTLLANNGARHVIDSTRTTLFLGAGVDGDAGTSQGASAGADDLFSVGGRDDEDGVTNHMDLFATIGATPKVTLTATNRTNKAATLYGWIDLNRDGVFDNATERTQVNVPTGTTGNAFTLTFPMAGPTSVGSTYARFRLSTDVAAANSTGNATDGEVEDYRFDIRTRLTGLQSAPTFVQNTVISSGVNGGPAFVPGDMSGFSTASIGDIDGDGIDDVAVAAPSDTEDTGAVYVMFLNANLTVKRSVRIASEVNGGPKLAKGDAFGAQVTSIGDINGDGIGDIAVGAFGDDTGSSGAGAVYLLRLTNSGTVKQATKLASSLNGMPPLSLDTGFCVVEAINDLDGNGTTDLVVGAPESNNGAGELFVLFMKSDGTVASWLTHDILLSENTAGFDGGFGSSITFLGDLDHDGTPELAVCSQIGDIYGSRQGWVSVVSLNRDGSIRYQRSFGRSTIVQPYGVYGSISDVVSAGDADGDGINDLLVAVDQLKDVAPGGDLFLLLMNSDGTVRKSLYVDPGDGIASTPAFPDLSLLVASLSFLNDVNRDGRPELLIGMPLFSMATGESSLYLATFDTLAPQTSRPDVPRVSVASTVTPNQRPQIQWVEESGRAASYEIWIRNDSSGSVIANGLQVFDNSYWPSVDLGLGRITVQVRARNEAGFSAWSAPLKLTINTATTLNPVADSVNRRTEFSWDAVPGAAKYELFLADSRTPATAFLRTLTAGAGTSFVPATPLPIGSWRLQVRPVAADGSAGAWSAVRTFKTGIAPSMTGVSGQTGWRPELTWDLINGAEKYEVVIAGARTPSVAYLRFTTETAVTSFRPTADLPTGNYVAWVRGFAGNVPGAWSAQKSFSTGLTLVIHGVPTVVDPGLTTTISWDAMYGVKSYQVWIDDPAPGLPPASSIQTVDASKTSLTFPVVLGRYKVWVRGISEAGTIGRWTAVSFSSPGIRLSGSITESTEANFSRPVFRWPAIAEAREYQIAFYRLSAYDGLTLVTSTTRTATEWQPAADQTLGRYRFQVRGVAVDGTFGAWSVPYDTTIQPRQDIVPRSDTYEDNPILTWMPVSGAQAYNVLVKNAVTGVIVDTIEVSTLLGNYNTFTSTHTLAAGRYQWQVAAVTDLGSGGQAAIGRWSEPDEFQIGGRAKLTVETGPVLRFTWNDLEANYDLWVQNDRGVAVIREQTLRGTQHTPAIVLPKGTYRAWIRPYGTYPSSVGSGPWSEVVTFTIT